MLDQTRARPAGSLHAVLVGKPIWFPKSRKTQQASTHTHTRSWRTEQAGVEAKVRSNDKLFDALLLIIRQRAPLMIISQQFLTNDVLMVPYEAQTVRYDNKSELELLIIKQRP